MRSAGEEYACTLAGKRSGDGPADSPTCTVNYRGLTL
jgi:hypothetical protein